METQNKEDLQKEIEELTALSKKQFKTGMIMMVGSLAVTLVCALLGSFMKPNPIQSQLDFIEKVSSYIFYLGLFFILRHYITRRKIPKDDGAE